MIKQSNYQDEIQCIKEAFGGKHILSFKEVQAYTGRSYDWCCKYLNIPHGNCTAVQLAKALANLK